jgi:hypothetical protein
MIDPFARQQLLELVKHDNGPCVSVYLPTGGAVGRQTQVPRIELKNLIEKARHKLSGHWMRDVESKRFLAPLAELTDVQEKWADSEQGLALFLNSAGIKRWRVAIPFESQAFVSNRFFVLPVLAAVNSQESFYILAVCQNKTELFHTNKIQMEKIRVSEMPSDIESALNLTATGRVSQMHMGSRDFGGKQSSIFHGQGGRRDTEKDEIQQYYRLINRAVTRHLAGSRDPLILACVLDDASIYRQVNTYPHLLEHVAQGSIDRLSDEQIHAQALPIINEFVRQSREAAIDSYRQHENTPRTLAETSALVSAAHDGRIDQLFVNQAAKLPGQYDRVNRTVDYKASMTDFDKDLIEETVAQTLLHRGNVYALAENEMPGTTEMVALLRY